MNEKRAKLARKFIAMFYDKNPQALTRAKKAWDDSGSKERGSIYKLMKTAVKTGKAPWFLTKEE